MAVTLTPLVTIAGHVEVWTCRSGPGHRRHGDPYVTTCVIYRAPGDTARIEAMCGPTLCKHEVDELKTLLRREGVVSMEWDRIRADGSVHRAVISMAR